MELDQRQRDILNGMLLGDAYLQKTSRLHARLRLEHSIKQKEYLYWKFGELEHIFQSEPILLTRMHPLSRQSYDYVRVQSYASLFLGELRQRFYDQEGKKKVPDEFDKIMAVPLTLAVWYMDDGYYDQRDKSAHIYLPAFTQKEIEEIIRAFRDIHDINCKAYCRPDRKACQLNFRKTDRDKLFSLIQPHLITTMSYKIPLSPVTTASVRTR